MNWLQSVQSLSGCGVKVGAVAFIGGLVSVYRRLNGWLLHHTTHAERSALAQYAVEGISYAEMLLAHAPIESRLEEAVRYVRKVADSRGISISDTEVRAVVAWAKQTLNRLEGNGQPAPVPPTNRPA